MLENFLTGTSALFGDPVSIGIFVFGVIGGMRIKNSLDVVCRQMVTPRASATVKMSLSPRPQRFITML